MAFLAELIRAGERPIATDDNQSVDAVLVILRAAAGVLPACGRLATGSPINSATALQDPGNGIQESF